MRGPGAFARREPMDPFHPVASWSVILGYAGGATVLTRMLVTVRGRRRGP